MLVKHNQWLNNAKKNLLPLSIAQDFSMALDEWEWTANIDEASSNDSWNCGLCEHPHLRYIFEIYNRSTDGTLWVGSECIKKFIRKHATKGYLAPKEMGRELSRTIRKLQKQQRINRLKCLMNELSIHRKYLNDPKWTQGIKKGFSFKQFRHICELLQTYGIAYSIADFRISVMKKNREQLKVITESEFRRYRPAFSRAWQKKLDLRFRQKVVQDEDK
jgi:hypothetical protein